MDNERNITSEEIFSKLTMLKKALKYAAMMAPMVGFAGYFHQIDNLINVILMSAGGMGLLTSVYNYIKFKAKGTMLEKLIP